MIKNLIVSTLLLGLLAFIAWPYVHIYQLDQALLSNNANGLQQLVDLDAVREQRKQTAKRETDRLVGKGDGDVRQFFRDGLRALTGTAVDAIIDLDWVRTELRRDGKPARAKPVPSMLDSLSYAFFEGPDQFLIRLGDLGDDPVHVRMQLQDWRWRVVAVFD